MAYVSLTVDVYCNRSEGEPTYRIYVDDEMLTERSWTWPGYEVFIRENIEVNVEPGAHRLYVRECNCDPVFETKNMTVNGEVNPRGGGLFFA
jgi:hypothetical protein